MFEAITVPSKVTNGSSVSFYSSSVCIKDYRLKKKYISFATEIMYSKTLIILTEVLEIMKKNCHKIINIQVTNRKKG